MVTRPKYSQKCAWRVLALDVPKFGKSSQNCLANVGESVESLQKCLANVSESGESMKKRIRDVAEISECRKYSPKYTRARIIRNVVLCTKNIFYV